MPPQQPQPTLLPSCFANSGARRPSREIARAFGRGGQHRRPACQEGGRNQRIPRKSFADDVRESVEPGCYRRKGVVAENGPVRHQPGRMCGDFPPCVLAGLVVKYSSSSRTARAKGGPVVRGAERLYPIVGFKWHASPHGNLLAVLPRGPRRQDWAWGEWFPEMASAKATSRAPSTPTWPGSQWSAPRRLRRCGGQNRHGTTLQIRRALN